MQCGQVWVVGLQQNLKQIHPGLIGIALANHTRVTSLQEDHLGPEQKLSYDAENNCVCQNNSTVDTQKTTQKKGETEAKLRLCNEGRKTAISNGVRLHASCIFTMS